MHGGLRRPAFTPSRSGLRIRRSGLVGLIPATTCAKWRSTRSDRTAHSDNAPDVCRDLGQVAVELVVTSLELAHVRVWNGLFVEIDVRARGGVILAALIEVDRGCRRQSCTQVQLRLDVFTR